METTTQFKTLLTNKGASAIFNSILDEATEDELIDNFYYRYCCDDDDKFILFFQRNLRKYKTQYVNYLRIEDTTFDPMVSRYLERKYTDVYTRKDTTSETRTGSNSNNYTVDVDGTTTDEGTNGSITTISGNTNDTVTYGKVVTDEDNATAKQIFSDMPQANVGAGTGSIGDTINYNYATNSTVNVSSDNKTSTGSGSDTTEGTHGETDTVSGTTSDTITVDNTSTYTGSGTTNNTLSGTDDSNSNSTHKEIYSGRDGSTPQEMLDMARNYITNTNALVWLIKQLDKCFMADFNYGEE